MTMVRQLQQIKALRERGIRRRNKELADAYQAQQQQRAQQLAKLQEHRHQWRAAVQEESHLRARALSHHVEKMAGYCSSDEQLVEQLQQARQEMERLRQEQEAGSIALRDNLRGQEKFSYLADQTGNQPRS